MYGSKQVNVGSLINPTEGISRSLTDLSNMYGRQADKKHQREVQAGGLALRNKADARSQLAADNTEAGRLANINFNKWATSDAAQKHVYGTDEMSKPSADLLNNAKSALTAERAEMLGSINSGAVNTELFKNNLIASGHSKIDASNRAKERGEALTRANIELSGLEGPAREARAKYFADTMYKPRFDSIENDIRTGKHLSNKERISSLMKSLDPEMVGRVPYERVAKVLGEKAGGFKISDLTAAEALRVKDKNAASRFNISNAVSTYNRANSARGKNSGAAFTSKDLDNYVKEMGGLDIGSWDNSDAQAAANKLLNLGHHPSAIVTVIKNNINKGFIDDTFFGKDDKNAFNALSKESAKLSGQLSKNKGTGYTSVSNPSVYRPESALGIDDLRRMRMNYSTNRQLKNYVPGEVVADVPSTETVAAAPENQIPVTQTVPVTATSDRVLPLPDVANSKSLISEEDSKRIAGLDPEMQEYELKSAENRGRKKEVRNLKTQLSTRIPTAKVAKDEAYAILDAGRLPIGVSDKLKNKDALFVATGRALGKPAASVSKADIDAFLGSKKGKSFESDYDRGETERVLNSSEKNSEIQKRLRVLDPSSQSVTEAEDSSGSFPEFVSGMYNYAKKARELDKVAANTERAEDAVKIRKAQDKVRNIQSTPSDSTVELRNRIPAAPAPVSEEVKKFEGLKDLTTGSRKKFIEALNSTKNVDGTNNPKAWFEVLQQAKDGHFNVAS